MVLKRIYNKDAPREKWVTTKIVCLNCKGKGKVVNDAVDGLEACPECENGVAARLTPPVDHIEIGNTGSTEKQNFSTRFVEAGIFEGWITLENGKITLHVRPEKLVYAINKRPGRYCSHCGEKLQDDVTGSLARVHVGTNHRNVKSPDPESPSGYAQVNAYLCTLDKAVHAKYRARREG